MQAEKQPFAFVIMPFEPEFDRIYANLVVPALELAGYEVKRADNVIDQQNILKDIIHHIVRADLIVAELTSLNPNVLYELGIAHGLLKPTVLIVQKIEEVPFDLRPYRIITYSTHYAEVNKLQDQLRDIAQRHKEGSIIFGNPVSDFAPSVLKQPHEIIENHPKREKEARATEIVEQPGILDFAVEGERSLQEITERTQRMNEMAISLAQKMTAHTAEIESIKRCGTPGTSARMHKVATAIASDMIKYAEDVEAELLGFHDAWERLVQNTTNLFSTVHIESAEDRDAMITLRSHMENFQKAISEALASVRLSRDPISKMKGVSRDLNRAVPRTTRAIDRIIEEFALGESYLSRMLNLINERLKTKGDKTQKF